MTQPYQHRVDLDQLFALQRENEELRLINEQLRREGEQLKRTVNELALHAEEVEDLRTQVVRLRRELGETSSRAPRLIHAAEPSVGRTLPPPLPVMRVPETRNESSWSSTPAGDPAPFVPPAMQTGSVGVNAQDQGIDFGAVSKLSPEELDRLPYGLITLDSEGRVIFYNDTESRLVGLPRERVVGRNFFREVAPCTRVRDFEGKFYDLVRDPSRVRVQTFDFVFRFARGEQHVTIVMTPARVRGQFHVAMVRRAR